VLSEIAPTVFPDSTVRPFRRGHPGIPGRVHVDVARGGGGPKRITERRTLNQQQRSLFRSPKCAARTRDRLLIVVGLHASRRAPLRMKGQPRRDRARYASKLRSNFAAKLLSQPVRIRSAWRVALGGHGEIQPSNDPPVVSVADFQSRDQRSARCLHRQHPLTRFRAPCAPSNDHRDPQSALSSASPAPPPPRRDDRLKTDFRPLPPRDPGRRPSLSRNSNSIITSARLAAAACVSLSGCHYIPPCADFSGRGRISMLQVLVARGIPSRVVRYSPRFARRRWQNPSHRTNPQLAGIPAHALPLQDSTEAVAHLHCRFITGPSLINRASTPEESTLRCLFDSTPHRSRRCPAFTRPDARGGRTAPVGHLRMN